jgi:hypothetical protein
VTTKKQKHLAVLIDGDIAFCGMVDEFIMQDGQAPELGYGMIVFKASYILQGEDRKNA